MSFFRLPTDHNKPVVSFQPLWPKKCNLLPQEEQFNRTKYNSTTSHKKQTFENYKNEQK